MSIPIVCSVCRTSMKVGEGFTEPKKIRCNGCGTVILLTPDPGNSGNVTISFPRKKEKKSGLTEAQKRTFLYAIFGVVCLVIAYALWIAIRTPDGQAGVEGRVTLDGAEMVKGKIRFDTLDGKFTAFGEISRGRYVISARHGPGIGMNKVKITCFETIKVKNPNNLDEEKDEDVDRVSPEFHAPENPLNQVEIKAGSNTFNFDPPSK